MDPVSIIGLVGSVAGIIDIISKNINFLRNLQSKYRQADFTVDLFIVQLSTLRAALNQVSQWIDELKTPQQHQLVEDLTISLQGCKVLVLLLDTQIDEFHKNDLSGNLTSKGKIDLLWKDSEMKEYQNHLNIQINALNLLLTAIQCRSKLDQNNLLSSGDSRRIIRLAGEDTSSLLMVQEDTESICTTRSDLTQSSRLLDVLFEFDRELFNSRAYHRALRSNMVHILSHHHIDSGSVGAIAHYNSDGDGHKSNTPITSAKTVKHAADGSLSSEEEPQPSDGNSVNDEPQAENHKAELQHTSGRMALTKSHHSLSEKDRTFKANRWFRIGMWKYRSDPDSDPDPVLVRHMEVEKSLIKMEEQRMRKDQKILLLGASNSGKSTLLNSMRLTFGSGFGLLELEVWKIIIRHSLCVSAILLMEAMESMNLPYKSFEEHERVKLLDRLRDMSDMNEDPFGCSYPGIAYDLDKLWKDAAIQEAINRSLEFRREIGPITDKIYFFNSLHRITHKDYIPSNSDVLSARLRTTGITETRLEVNRKTDYLVWEVGGVRSERRRWIHAFENARALVFTVDLAGFNEPLYEDKDADCMEESLLLFQNISNSQWFTNSAIILLFTKVDKLGPKLKISPLENTFTDYTGGPDIDAAKTYITEKFVALVLEHHRPLCVCRTSFVGDETSPARVVSNGIEYLTKDSGTIHVGHENASYFIMGEDGIPTYH